MRTVSELKMNRGETGRCDEVAQVLDSEFVVVADGLTQIRRRACLKFHEKREYTGTASVAVPVALQKDTSSTTGSTTGSGERVKLRRNSTALVAWEAALKMNFGLPLMPLSQLLT